MISNFTCNNDVLIIGYGNVGSNILKKLINLNCDVCDKYLFLMKRHHHHKLGIICVDTPLMKNNELDITEVRNAIIENDCDMYMIKSTVPLGTTEKLSLETGKRVIFSPEYYGTTQHCNNFDFDFTILGGDKETCIEIIQMLQKCYDARHQFRITDSKTAELVKFMENSFLATKVSFCCEFFKTCEKNGINYEELRELFLLDERVGKSHTFVYRDAPYWDSHCLNKDVPYIAYTQNMPILQKIVEVNEEGKNEKESHKKEEIE